MIIKQFEELKTKVLSIASRNQATEEIEKTVKNIIDEVRSGGLKAVQKFTLKFDKKQIDNFKVSSEGAFEQVEPEQQKAIKLAAKRIKAFQEACLPKQYFLEDELGRLEVLFRPLESAGLYIPGGKAPLVSTLLMTAIPALTAKVERIIIVSPPTIHKGILAVADYLGLKEIYQIGGVQAIGVLAFGLPEIGLEPVDKIAGPGNLYVTLAKKLVYGQVGIDALYGPSELVIIADESQNPKALACDLMSQLEHGSGLEAACLFTNSDQLATAVLKEFETILLNQPNKSAIEKAWQKFGLIGVTENLEQAIELANLFAPEHLELKIENSHKYISAIKHAGAVFTNQSNEALGDYLAGPSHCLPTNRSARFSSGLSVCDFLKRMSLIDLKPNQELIEATAVLARMEGLEAHAQAALNAKL